MLQKSGYLRRCALVIGCMCSFCIILNFCIDWKSYIPDRAEEIAVSKYYSPPEPVRSDSYSNNSCSALEARYIDAVRVNNVLQVHQGHQSEVPVPLGLKQTRPSSLEKIKATQSLLRQYTNEHNVNSVLSYLSDPVEGNLVEDRALCQSNRAFVLGVYSCPQQLGSRIHEFLNAFATAVITNRTLLWKFCDRGGCSNQPGDCDSFFKIASLKDLNIASSKLALQNEPWIPEAATVIKRLYRGGCEYPTYRWSSTDRTASLDKVWRYEGTRKYLRSDAFKVNRAFLNGVAPRQLVPNELHNSVGESVVACCGIDSLSDERMLDIGILERRELLGLSFPGVNLGPRAHERARILFSGGAAFAYGELMRFAFSFGASVLDWNSDTKSKIRFFSPSKRRVLSRDPVPDDDAPPVPREQKGIAVQKKTSTPTRKAGRQELPQEALALRDTVGKTSVRSPQGTSVGPMAGGSSVIIADAGGVRSSEAAQRAGAAPPEKLKSASSPAVKPLVAHKRPSKTKPQFADDHWKKPFAGNHTARFAAGESRANVAGRNFQNGGIISDKVSNEKPTQQALFSYDVKRIPNPHSALINTLSDGLLNALYGSGEPNIGFEGDIDAAKVKVKKESQPNLQNKAPFILAVHIRHPNALDSGNDDRMGELSCIKTMLQIHVSDYSKRLSAFQGKASNQDSPKLDCIVILASDREATLARLQREASSLGCEVGFAPRAHDTNELSVEATRLKFRKDGEHGPYKAGILPLADLELLSHADAFIGSSDSDSAVVNSPQPKRPSLLSTYSMLISSLIASNERSVSRMRSNPSHNILTHEADFIRWLPRCGNSFSSYRTDTLPSVEPIMTEKRKRNAISLGGDSTGSGNGFYESTDCPFFSWNQQCVDEKVRRAHSVCTRE